MNDLDRGMLQHNKLPDLALDKLMEWIMSGKLSMGDKLNTEELASQLGVSRMPIREALANLEKKGLAESVPYAGTRLVTLTKDDVRQIYIARTALEPVAAKYACEKITDEDIQNLKEIHAEYIRIVRQEELDAILDDPKELEDARLLGDYRQAFARRHASLKPDVNKEWNNFRQSRISGKNKGKQLWIGISIGVAASVLLFFSWQMFNRTSLVPVNQPIVAFTASTQSQEVLLSTGDGRMVSLSAPQADSLLRETGITRGDEELDYQQTIRETEIHTLTTPRCGAYQLRLADGTQVWLNAESRLKYPSRFTGEQRVVELEGEGYFKVTPDSKRPFIVKSGDITTEVLGTEFNVRTYVSNDSHVTLLKGSVKVKNVSSSSEVVIRPGEDAHLQGDGTFDVREVDTDNYYLWTEGYFYFDNETVVEIMRELGRWYNIRVEFENPQAMNYRLHFLAERDQKIEEVLQLLNMLGKVQATYENNKISVK